MQVADAKSAYLALKDTGIDGSDFKVKIKHFYQCYEWKKVLDKEDETPIPPCILAFMHFLKREYSRAKMCAKMIVDLLINWSWLGKV